MFLSSSSSSFNHCTFLKILYSHKFIILENQEEGQTMGNIIVHCSIKSSLNPSVRILLFQDCLFPTLPLKTLLEFTYDEDVESSPNIKRILCRLQYFIILNLAALKWSEGGNVERNSRESGGGRVREEGKRERNSDGENEFINPLD